MAKSGRPPKNNCDYFRHFTTMRNHRKIKALRTKFGQVLGYAFWSMFIEYLTEQDGNEMEYSDMEVELFAGELGVSATEIRDMVDFCIKMEMVFLKDGFINSDSLDEELKFVYEKRETAKIISETRKRRGDGKFDSNTESLGVSATEITNQQDISVLLYPQIREEKIREDKQKKNIKKKSEKATEQELMIFDEFRKEYGGTKRGNQTEMECFQKHEDWKTILPTLPSTIRMQVKLRQLKHEKGLFVSQWKNMATWLNQRCWEEENILPFMPISNNGNGNKSSIRLPDKPNMDA